MPTFLRRKGTVAALLALLLTASVALYFFAVRPADSDYASAAKKLETLQENTHTISAIFATTSPLFFDDATKLDSFISTVDSYQESAKAFTESAVAQRDGSVKAKLANTQSTIVDYGNAVKATTAAVANYYTITENCGFIRIYTPATLSNDQQSNCEQAFSAIDSLPDSGFKSQFLTNYADSIKEITTVVLSSKTAKEKQATLEKLRNQLEPLFTDTEINYNLPASPKDHIAQMLSVVNQQKSAFLR